jgi:hypothetical protein
MKEFRTKVDAEEGLISDSFFAGVLCPTLIITTTSRPKATAKTTLALFFTRLFIFHLSCCNV